MLLKMQSGNSEPTSSASGFPLSLFSLRRSVQRHLPQLVEPFGGEVHAARPLLRPVGQGKLTAGSVWYFDFSTFTPRNDIYAAERFPYLQRLFQNTDFRQAAEQRWQEVRPKMMSIPEYIDQQARLIWASAMQNSLMWPISLELNGDEKMSFDEAIERMKQSFELRLSVVDRYFTEQQ